MEITEEHEVTAIKGKWLSDEIREMLIKRYFWVNQETVDEDLFFIYEENFYSNTPEKIIPPYHELRKKYGFVVYMTEKGVIGTIEEGKHFVARYEE